METVKLLFIFILILLALHKKVSVGVTLFGAGLLTALLFRIPFSEMLSEYKTLVTSERFISLTAVICLITMLGSMLRELGFLQALSDAARKLRGGKRTASAVLPPLVGLMPMPGGALLSAPLIDEVLADKRYSPHFKCAVNYWFRHVVEHFMPIYPGMILSEAVTGLPARNIAALQSPLAVIMIVIGLIFFIRKIKVSDASDEAIKYSLLKPILQILKTLWPVASVLILYVAFEINMAISVLIVIVFMLIVLRPSRDKVFSSFKKGFSYKLIFLVFGILSFQTMLDYSGAINAIQQLSIQYGLPEQLIIIIVCFTAGILTGMFAAFVALGYTLLAGFLYQPEIIPANVLLAFIFGYVGMMLSPTHLCLILTNDYFKSDLLKVYKLLIIPALLLALGGYLLYLSGWASLIKP